MSSRNATAQRQSRPLRNNVTARQSVSDADVEEARLVRQDLLVRHERALKDLLEVTRLLRLNDEAGLRRMGYSPAHLARLRKPIDADGKYDWPKRQLQTIRQYIRHLHKVAQAEAASAPSAN